MSPGRSTSARASRSPPALVGGEVARSQSLGFELRLDSVPNLDTCGAAGVTDLGALPHHLVSAPTAAFTSSTVRVHVPAGLLLAVSP
jgi:hypothetical protein